MLASGGLTKTKTPEAPLAYDGSAVEWTTARLIGRAPPLASRLFLYVVIFIGLVGGLYASFAKVALVVQAPGLIVPERGAVPILAPATFVVSALFVANNDQVRPGDRILISEDRLSEEDLGRLIETSTLLQAELAKDRELGCGPCLDRIATRELDLVLETKGTVRENIAGLRKLIQEYLSARRIYAARGAGGAELRRRIEIAQKKIAEIRRRKAEKLLELDVERLESEIVAARAAMADRARGDRGGLDALRGQLVIQLTELPRVLERYQAQHEVRSPIAGVVTELQVAGAGQLLSAGQVLMSVVAIDSPLAVELRVANEDVSKVRPDMVVRMKLAAFPEREYGVVLGKVRTVAPSASFDQKHATTSGAVAQTQARATYQVMVSLDRQFVEKDGKAHPFRIGMTLNGLVVARYESMLSLFIRRVLQIKDDFAPEV